MDELRDQLRRIKNNRLERKARGDRGRAIHPLQFLPDPTHYHVLYSPMELDDIAIPDFRRLYRTKKEAYLQLQEMGQESEPNTVWSEDGRVMIETRLHGRVGLFKVMLEVVECLQSGCGKVIDDTPFAAIIH